VFISHADCYDDAVAFKNAIVAEVGKDLDVHIGYVGPCIGATVGPGMLGVYYYGKKVVQNAE